MRMATWSLMTPISECRSFACYEAFYESEQKSLRDSDNNKNCKTDDDSCVV